MANNLINDYPYTNMTYQNVDWLVDIVSKLVEKGKDNGEIKADDEVAAAYSQFINNYPYTNMTYQNIDWWINKVREIGAEQVKLIAQMETLQADVNNIVNKFGDKVDKLNVKNNVYVTDGSTPPKTTGIAYSELPVEGTIPFRDGIGSLQVPTAQDATQAVNKGQMDTALDGKVDKTTESARIYGTDANGNPHLYEQGVNSVPWSVPIRNGNGAIVAANPTQDNELTTKEYVDNAIATAPTGGWVTVIDKTWTEDETTTTAGYIISIPTEYQKPAAELRLRYYMNTPQEGAIYKSDMQVVVLDTAQKSCSIAYVATNKLIDKDTQNINVNFVGDTNKISSVLGSGSSDLFNDCYGIYVYKDSNGNAVQPIPTDPNALLNTSKIIGIAEGNHETTEYILNTCLPNRSHSYTTTSTQVTVNYTSNDYYNDQLPNCIISQVLTSTDETNLSVGSFICVERRDLIIALNISIVFSGTASVSYKQVFTVHADIIDESIQGTYSGLTLKDTMTSFDERAGVETLSGSSAVTYYNGTFNDGTPTAIKLLIPTSTSNGVTAKKIYAGSRLVVQVKY